MKGKKGKLCESQNERKRSREKGGLKRKEKLKNKRRKSWKSRGEGLR